MGFLYIGPKGKPHTKHSYSAGNDWECPYRYYLRRILGWKETNKRARFEFGKAFESAIQFYHENFGDKDAAIKHFTGLWGPWKDVQLEYTKVEKGWAQCHQIGIDWLKLYAIRQPSLPIPIGGQSIFQREYVKEVFPGDPNYGGIEYLGKPDIISYTEPDHPMLPRLDWKPEYGAFRPLIVDIKTSGADFPEQYGLAAHDSQLRTYSWLTGIRDASLLWFVKKGLTLQKGYSVTMLEDVGFLKAGQEAVVALVEDDGIWLLPNDFMVEEMERAQGQKNGKTEQTNVAKERRAVWLEENGSFAQPNQITKQRLQFNAGFVTIESADDAGLLAQKQIIEIANAWQTKKYPNKFGVRYPNDNRSDPYFRAFVLKDEAYLKQNFTKTDEDVDLFAEEEPDGAV
jgi:hypothetical protein